MVCFFSILYNTTSSGRNVVSSFPQFRHLKRFVHMVSPVGVVSCLMTIYILLSHNSQNFIDMVCGGVY